MTVYRTFPMCHPLFEKALLGSMAAATKRWTSSGTCTLPLCRYVIYCKLCKAGPSLYLVYSSNPVSRGILSTVCQADKRSLGVRAESPTLSIVLFLSRFQPFHWFYRSFSAPWRCFESTRRWFGASY